MVAKIESITLIDGTVAKISPLVSIGVIRQQIKAERLPADFISKFFEGSRQKSDQVTDDLLIGVAYAGHKQAELSQALSFEDFEALLPLDIEKLSLIYAQTINGGRVPDEGQMRKAFEAKTKPPKGKRR